MTEKHYLYERRFLNSKSGRAYSIATVQKTIDQKNEHYVDTEVYVNLELGDCSRSINLDFSFDATKKSELSRQMKKIDSLIETFKKVKTAMKKDNHKVVSAVKAYNKKRKKKKSK